MPLLHDRARTACFFRPHAPHVFFDRTHRMFFSTARTARLYRSYPKRTRTKSRLCPAFSVFKAVCSVLSAQKLFQKVRYAFVFSRFRFFDAADDVLDTHCRL